MKILAALLLAVPIAAHAGSFFQFEAGLGASFASDADGIWTQHNVADNHERLNTLAYTAGVTGELYEKSNVSVRYHADYVYMGTQSASCMCVSDADYAAHNYSGPALAFTGSGHIQGVALTLEPGYTYHGTRFAAEAGPFIMWETWSEDTQGLHIYSPSGPRLAYVVGARVERGNFSLSYRYFTHFQKNSYQYPGLVRSMHTLSAVWRF